MPEVTLSANIESLQETLAAVGGLLGTPSSGSQPGTGLAGAASLVANTPTDRIGAFTGELTGQMSGTFDLDLGPLSQIGTLLSTLPGLVQEPPRDILAGVTVRLETAADALSTDAMAPMRAVIDAITAISQSVPVDRTAIVSTLVDQLVAVFAALDGPEARAVQAWIDSVAEQARSLLPLIEAGASVPDPAALVLAVFERSLTSTIETFGLGQVGELVAFLDGFLGTPLDAGALPGLVVAFDATLAGYGQVLAAVNVPYPQFRTTVTATIDAMVEVKRRLRPILLVLHQIARARILQPGAIEAFLRMKLDEALGVPVHETQRIDDPFAALFARIDGAIDGIDLAPVREQVLGFFDTTREAIDGVNVGGVGDQLAARLATVEQAVAQVEQAVAELQERVVGFIAGAAGRVRSAATPLGTFLPDGAFRYRFEADLRAALNAARTAIAGDPARPGAPSVAGALRDFQSTVDGFATQLRATLAPVDGAVSTVVDAATGGIAEFSEFLTGLDVPAVIADAEAQLQQVMDAIGEVDFAVVADPFVATQADATEKVRSIDVSSLNETVRAALGASLGLVVEVDFSAEVRVPLHDLFAAISNEAVDELRDQVARLTAMLDALAPTQLLADLFAAFDTVRAAVGSLDVAALLAPLDRAHAEHLQQPLEALLPSDLLRPAADAFAACTAAFAAVQGATVLAPLQSGLDELRSAVAGFDVAGRIDEVVAAVDRVRGDLGALRPSLLLAPLVAEVERLTAALERFRPTVVFAPVTALATPLLQFLEGVTEQTIQALFDLFRRPLTLLERVAPEPFAAELRGQVQALLNLLAAADIPGRVATLGVRHLELTGAISAGGVQAKADLALFLDPGRQFGELLATYEELVAALEKIRDGLVWPDLTDLYAELRTRLVALLPPYARELLDPEVFRRVMRLADPTRFVAELDARFDALVQKLLPVSPVDIAAGLDASWEALVELLDGVDVGGGLARVAEVVERITGVLDGLRLDAVGAAIDGALADVRAVVAGLDPARFAAELDALHGEVAAAVAVTRPSVVLAGLQGILDDVNRIVARLDLRTALGDPLDAAWAQVTGVVGQLDIGPLLDPLVNKLAELEAGVSVALDRIEHAFDDLLRAAQAVLGGSGGLSVGASVEVGVSGGVG